VDYAISYAARLFDWLRRSFTCGRDYLMEAAQPTPLQWLGGSEEAVLAEKHLRLLRRLLQGDWIDQADSLYTLTLNATNDKYLDVKTQRPSGFTIVKRALLKLGADGDGARCCWGAGRFALIRCSDGSISWRDGRGRDAFNWKKMQ